MTTAMRNALCSDRLYPIRLAEIEFASGWVRAWSGIGTLTWDSKEWLGVGQFGGISEITESARVEANGVSFFLVGAPAGELLEQVMLEGRHGKPARAYEGAMTANAALIADPVLYWSGLVDAIALTEDPDNPKVEIRSQSRIAQMKKSQPRRYTHEDQQLTSPGDTGFRYVATLQKAFPVYVPPPTPYDPFEI